MMTTQGMLSSQASIMVDSQSPLESADMMSVVSGSDANDAPPPDTVAVAEAARRRRWALFRRGDDDDDGTGTRIRSLSITCRFKSAFKGSCLITCASIIEMLGNLLALIYGIAFIQGAINFYQLDTDPEKRAQEYEEKLDRVLFLEKNRVGYVGLLATCVIGLIVSFLMPFGTIYKNWKSLRVCMSLLFSICLAHVILASVYLADHLLMATLAIIPYRLYEILLLYNYINIAKKKKLEEALKALDDNTGDAGGIDSQLPLRAGSASSLNQARARVSDDMNPVTSDVQLGLDVTGKGQSASRVDFLSDDQLGTRDRRSSKRRKMAQAQMMEQQRKPRANFIAQPDAYPEYK